MNPISGDSSVQMDTSISKPLNLYGIKYDGPAMDSLNLLRQFYFQKSLFIFNDNFSEHYSSKKGSGNAVLRQFNQYSGGQIRSFGIPTGHYRTGYSSLEEGKVNIDRCFEELIALLKTGNYDSIVYSINLANDPLLGTGIFQVSPEVLKYITKRIMELCVNGSLYCISSTYGMLGPILIDNSLSCRYN